MPASPTATAEQIKDANTRYHDAAADSYDAKWGIDFGGIGQDQVRGKLVKALGDAPETPFGDALEIGAGTGYFTLNLLQIGLIERATATDISPGMLAALGASARRLGVEVNLAEAEAEELPFADRSFDLVFGHAVLHHIPDLDRAFAEFHRVLRPGGTITFCGEPSRYGDRLAAFPKRAGRLISPAWRRLVGAARRDDVEAGPTARNGERPGDGAASVGESAANFADHELESEVDVHAFSPRTLSAVAERGGFTGIRIRGEELLANAYGWLVRTLEGSAVPEQVPMRWRTFAFRSYILLQRVDAAALEPHLPPALFYNLVLSARRPPVAGE
jgi:ubiquinone/menaquinone biosynthesis C-methylase UbiE